MLKLALISGEQKILLDFQFSLKEPHHFLVKTFRVKFGHNLRMLEMTAVSLSERQSFLEFKTLTQESVSMQAATNLMRPLLRSWIVSLSSIMVMPRMPVTSVTWITGSYNALLSLQRMLL